jgi:hypothetical protein
MAHRASQGYTWPHHLRLTAVAMGALFLAGCSSSPTGKAPVYEGKLDAVNKQEIGGWVWDANQPNAALQVDIYDGDTKLLTVMANMDRSDVRKAGRGTGKYGFSFPPPDKLKDGKPHTIHARVTGTDTELEGSPKTVVLK